MSLSLCLLLVKGIAAGGASGLPLGPMGLQCLNQTLRHGRRAGLISAAGIALALGLWTGILQVGMATLTPTLLQQQDSLRGLIGVAVIFLGFRGLKRPNDSSPVSRTTSKTLTRSMAGTFVVVAANPLTPVTLIAVFTLMGLMDACPPIVAAGKAAAVTAGALLLWLALTQAVWRFSVGAGRNLTLKICCGLSWMLVFLGTTQVLLATLRLLGFPKPITP
ncbi:MAG: hypothetical protein RI897_419 [Verrucomicrobiota bacterium]|jgi:putative LysE/RhtB family amino acid efflux pump